MGAESLRQAGVPNRVVALRNGTMGWELAGLVCDRGREERFQTGRPNTAELAMSRASAFAARTGVRVIGVAELERFAADGACTLYVLDVRDPEEFAHRARPGSVNAPGGQLVQATDSWIGVRGARIALIDDDGVRARMSAAWLRLMGHRDVFVVEGGLAGAQPPGGTTAPELEAAVETIGADQLAAAPDAVVVDLARSVEYREGHIPGALWGVRSRLAALKPRLADARMVVVTSPDGLLARLAVAEVQGLTKAPVRVLTGGTAAWKQSGGALAKDRTVPPDEACIDFYLRPYDRNSGIEEAMHAYLSWEIDLVHEIKRDGTVAFGALASNG
jgi:rhodanese-related sulfurtransferase